MINIPVKDEIRQFVEQIEGLDEDRREAASRISETYAEAKARGYDCKALRAIVALRRQNKDDVAEYEAILELYKNAMGMA